MHILCFQYTALIKYKGALSKGTQGVTKFKKQLHPRQSADMSLISTAVDVPDENSAASPSVRASVYQKNGKPLSKEALFRAKLKYGVYQSPARQVGTGVSDSKVASDVAATLANSNRTTIEAYKRLMVDSNASRAATIVSSRPRTSSVSSTTTVTSDTGSLRAATKALSVIPPAPAPQVSPAKSGALNISKVLVGAEANAEKRIESRMNPEKTNYVYGIKTGDTGKAAEKSFTLTSEIMGRITSKEEYIAEAEAEADPKKYASHAAYAVRNFDPKAESAKELAEREKKKQAYYGMLTSEEVLSMAKVNAQVRLDAIDRMRAGDLLFKNEEYNKLAVAIAQKNSTQRSQHLGKINLGGGLWLTQDDVQNIAKGLITPVLDEVGTRAGSQRALDADIKQRNVDYKEQNAAWIKLQEEKLTNDKIWSRETRLRHKRETEGLHTRTEAKYKDLCSTKDAELAAMQQTLAETQKSYESLKVEMDQNLEEEAARVKNELATLKEALKVDMASTLAEQEAELKPYSDDVKAAEAEHERLVKERESIDAEIKDLRTSIEEHKAKIEQLTKDIEDAEVKHGDEDNKLQELSATKEESEDKVENHFRVLAEKAKEQAALSSEEARVKQLEVDAMINERQNEFNATDLQLKKEKLALLESMKDVAQIKGDEKLDESKLKALIGMTSDEFIAQQKEEEEKLAKSKLASASTKFIKDQSGVISSSAANEDNDEVNSISEEPTSANAVSSKAAKTSTTPDGPKKYSMVDAVLPDDFKPLKPVTKNTKETKQTTASPEKKPTQKKKFFSFGQKKSSPSEASPTSPTPAKEVAADKKDSSKGNASNSEVSKPKEAEKKTVDKKVVVKEPSVEPKADDGSKDLDDAKPAKPEVTSTESPSAKEDAATSSSAANKTVTKQETENELEHTFSGFSQEPAPEKTKATPVEPSEEDDDLIESSEAGEGELDSDKKVGSLFKEVF